MSDSAPARRAAYLDRPSPSSLSEVVEQILDKGLVIDAYARVSLLGVELVTIDARVVIASVDTYLRFAEATSRLDLYAHGTAIDEMPKKAKRQAVKGAAKGALSGVKETIKEAFSGDELQDRRRR